MSYTEQRNQEDTMRQTTNHGTRRFPQSRTFVNFILAACLLILLVGQGATMILAQGAVGDANIAIDESGSVRILNSFGIQQGSTIVTNGRADVVTVSDRIVVIDNSGVRIFNSFGIQQGSTISTNGRADVVTTAFEIVVVDNTRVRIYNFFGIQQGSTISTNGRADVVTVSDRIVVIDNSGVRIFNSFGIQQGSTISTNGRADVVTTADRVVVVENTRVRIYNFFGIQQGSTINTNDRADVVTTADRIVVIDQADVTAINIAPVLNNSGDPILAAINEDETGNNGTLVSSIITSVSSLDMITDANPGALEGLAIIDADESNGDWQYSTNGGATWTALGSPTNSSARLLASDTNTRIRFVPNPNFNGTVSAGLTFRAWDRTSGSNGGTANTTNNGGSTAFSLNTETTSITVNPVNDPPNALDDTATTPANTPRIISVLGNDTDPENDPLTVSAVGLPSHGTATLNPDETVTYPPDPGFTGSDAFTYTIRDPAGLIDTATVTVNVGAGNTAPNAVDDTATTLRNTPVTIAVLGNDTDLQNDTLTVVDVGVPGNGVATTNGTTVTYTPTPNFTGVDQFTYIVSDGDLTDTAMVVVTVGLLWEDDPFDNLVLGLLDGQSGWGRAAPDRASPVVTTDPIAPSRGQVLEIDAAPDETIVMGKDVPDQTSGRHIFSVWVKVTGTATQPSVAKIEIGTDPSTGWTKKFQLYFGSSMRVNYSPSGAAAIIVPDTISGRWYYISADIDLDTNLLDVWVDGQPMASNIPIHPGPITDLGISGWDRGDDSAVLLDYLKGLQAAQPGVTLTVNTTEDELNNDGDCSLREAIRAANTNAAVDACTAGVGADTITFSVTGIIVPGSALPDIGEDLTVAGPGATNLTISGSGNDAVSVFVVNADITLNLHDLTIANAGTAEGGGIFNDGGTVNVSNSTFSGNNASSGGGIFNNGGTVSVSNSTLADNSTDGAGGGIYNSGTLIVTNSTFSGNRSDSEPGGGGVFNDGTLTVINSTFSGNSAVDEGGAVINSGTATVMGSTFSANRACDDGGGGAIDNRGTLLVMDSIFSRNDHCLSGGGIGNDGMLT